MGEQVTAKHASGFLEPAIYIRGCLMKHMGRKRRAAAGYTFIEVLVAITLLVVGFLGLYASLNASSLLRETANETNIAMFKLQNTMEYTFNLPFDDIVTTLPEGVPIDIAALTDGDSSNDYSLNNEVITIAYEDPAADPLKFTITINWSTRMGNARSASISSGRVR